MVAPFAPPPRVARIRTLFPGGATRNIVGSHRPTGGGTRAPNNIANGTSAARDTYPHNPPELKANS